jgi:hypothetical protein
VPSQHHCQDIMRAGAVNDYQKDLQFKKLNAQKDIIEVKVLRNGEDQLIGNEEVVVGDILLLDTGDKVCAGSIEAQQLASWYCVTTFCDVSPCTTSPRHACAGDS